jgi:hypothetical protein
MDRQTDKNTHMLTVKALLFTTASEIKHSSSHAWKATQLPALKQ